LKTSTEKIESFVSAQDARRWASVLESPASPAAPASASAKSDGVPPTLYGFVI
jgi:hypothetical protein